MFESLIKSILDKVAGEYIQGLNTENLSIGIFSGDVKIENVSLNPKILELLELPLTLVYSNINKLKLNVPFKNLGSKPVEVFLDGLYIIVKATPESQWNFRDYKAFLTKLSNIQQFSEQCIQKIVDRQKQQEDKNKEGGANDKGYVQKLTMKIIDNLQITIKNIHVRFEDSINQKFSWGFCLDKIEINTTDAAGINRCFVDRTNESNKNEPMRKILLISNAGLYWNANETIFLENQADEQKLKILNGMILKEGETTTTQPVDFLFKLTSQLNLTMHNKGDFDHPEIIVSLDLKRINLDLSQLQLQQIIEQIEFLSKFQRELAFRKRNEKKPSPEEIERLSAVFASNFTKVLENDKTIKCLSKSESQEFENALTLLDIEILHQQTKKVVIEVQKALKIRELEIKKQNEKKGFFGKWFGGKGQDKSQSSQESQELVTEEERLQINKFISDNFNEEAIDAPLIIRPKSYVFMDIQFNLEGASIVLSKAIGKEVQSVGFHLDHLSGKFDMSEEGNNISVILGSMNLTMKDYFSQNNTFKQFDVLKTAQEETALPLIEFTLASKTLVSNTINLNVRSVRFDYNSSFITRITTFMNVNVKDEQLKQEAKEKIQETLDEQQQQISKAMSNPSTCKLILDVHLESPVIVIPFSPDGSLVTQCWVLNLGTLAVNTPKAQLSLDSTILVESTANNGIITPDIYNLSLSKIRLSYFPSVEHYNMYLKSKLQLQANVFNQTEIYHTIEEFSVIIRAAVLPVASNNQPKILVSGSIDQINLKLKTSIYCKLLKFGECFETPKEELRKSQAQVLEEVQLEKKTLLKNAAKTSILFRRETALKTWEKYHAVLSNGYIYFFQNPKDLKPCDYVWIKDPVITTLDENVIGFKNAFNVKNKYSDLYLASEKEKTSTQWIEALQTQVSQLAMTITDQELDEVVLVQNKLEENPKEIQKAHDFEAIQIEASFELGKVQLSLYDEVDFTANPFVVFSTNQLSVFFQQRDLRTEASVKLASIQLSDYLYAHSDGSLNDFIVSQSMNSSSNIGKELIKIDALLLEKDHPDFKGISLKTQLNFNTLVINIKPETIAKFVMFFNADTASSSPAKNLQDQAAYSDQLTAAGTETDLSSHGTSNNLQENITTLISADVYIHEIKIVLVNRRNHLPISDISISQLQVTFNQKSDEIFLKSSLGNLCVRDLTNFPNTIYQEADWQRITPQQLIGIKKSTGEKNSLLELEFTSYDQNSPKISQSDNAATIVKLFLQPIEINLLMQPILRIADFFSSQLGRSVTNPLEYFDSAQISKIEDPMQQQLAIQRKATEQLNSGFEQFTKKEVKQLIQNSKEMLLNVTVMNPVIKLSPSEDSKERLEVDLGVIKVNNERDTSKSRVLKGREDNPADMLVEDGEAKSNDFEVLSENYKVSLTKMQIRVISNIPQSSSKHQEQGISSYEITKEFNVAVNANMLALEKEYEYAYPEIHFDKRTKLQIQISPLILRFSNNQINFLNACLEMNVNYDDGCDCFYIQDYEINKLAAAVIERTKREEQLKIIKQKTMVSQIKQDEHLIGLLLDLNLESLSIFAIDKPVKNGNKDSYDNIPFAIISIGKLQFSLDNTPTQELMAVQAKSLTGSWFSKNTNNQTYFQRTLLGDMQETRIYTLQEISDLSYLVAHSQQRRDEVSNDIQGESLNQINFRQSSAIREPTVTEIKIADFQLHLESIPILKFVSFAEIQKDSVVVKQPVYSVELTQAEKEEQEKENIKIEQFKKQISTQSILKLHLQNLVVCTPCADGSSVLALRGAVNVELSNLPTSSIEDVKQAISLENLALAESYKLNCSDKLTVQLKDLELFICQMKDLALKKFKNLRKRTILLPTNLSMTKSDYLFVASMESQLFSSKTVIDCKLQGTQIRLAFQDLHLLDETRAKLQIDFQVQENKPNDVKDQNSQQKLSQNQKSAQKLNEEERMQQQLQEQESKIVVLAQNEEQINQLDVVAEITDLQVFIVNDLNARYVPVLSLTIEQLSTDFSQNNIALKAITLIQFKAEYFNPRVSTWEPVIERVGFQIDYLQSELNPIQQLIIIEMNPNFNAFNITLSSQLLSVLERTTQTVKQGVFPMKDKLKGSVDSFLLNDSELVLDQEKQLISPYSILNETGYPIDVEVDSGQMNQSSNLANSVENKQPSRNKLNLLNCKQKCFDFNDNSVDAVIENDKTMQLGSFVAASTGSNIPKGTNFNSTQKYVKVRVLVPGEDLRYIEQIDIDKIRSKVRFCRSFAKDKKPLNLITEVKLDIATQNKVLCISSPFLLINNSTQTMTLTFYGNKNAAAKETIVLKKGRKTPVPIDLLEGQFTIAFDDSENPSEKLQIQKIVKKREEIKIGERFVILSADKDADCTKKTLISLDPPYRIKNCLPKTLIAEVSTGGMFPFSQKSEIQVVTSGEAFEFFGCSQKSECGFRVQFMNHFWSNQCRVSANTVGLMQLKDSDGNISEITVQQSHSADGCNNLFVFCKGYLVNESPHRLRVVTQSGKDKSIVERRLVGVHQKASLGTGNNNHMNQNDGLSSHVILFGSETCDLLRLADDSADSQLSKETNIGGVGDTQLDILTTALDGTMIYQTMGVSVAIKNIDKANKLFSKVITLSPRFIIVNKTGMSLEVKQKGFDDKVTGIDVDTRIPLYWYDDSESRFLNVRLVDEEKDWEWSGNLNVLELGTVNFLCRNKNQKMDLLFMRTDVRSDDSNIFIVIEKLTPKERPFLVQNLSKKVKLQLDDLFVTLQNAPEGQVNYYRSSMANSMPNRLSVVSNNNNNEEEMKLPADQEYYFSWDQPFDKERKVVSHITPLNGTFKNIPFTFSPDQIYFQDKIEIASLEDKKKESSLYLKWSIDIDGFTRIIRFEDSSFSEPVTQKEKKELRKKIQKEQDKKRKQNEKQQKEREKTMKKAQKEGKEMTIPEMKEEPIDIEEKPIIQQQISVLIKDFGVSIVQNNRMNEKPKEFLYLTIKGLEFIMITKEESKTTQARIKLMNIDQNSSYSLANPVIFTPQKFAQYNKPDSENFFINLVIEQNLLAKNITLYNNLAIEIDPFALRIEDQFINTLLDFLKAVDEARFDADAQALNTLKDYLNESEQIQKTAASKFKWQESEIPPTSLPTFINQLILSNIDLALTFKSKAKASDNDLNVLKSVFTALGVVLADIDAPIKLKGIKLTNCFESVQGIVSKLTTHFKDQAIREVLKVFGSLNIIGNPVGLFSNISTGMVDLIQKPAEGFVKGPLEGGLGIMQGASSLIKNTMAGAFNSVNKITGSLSSGISSLCMDEQYLEQREKMRQKKPKHIGEGAVQGVTSIFSGVANGITGVFLQPFQGAKAGGAKGFLKGLGKGIVGLVVKPVSGVLDAASTAAEGLKNTITYGDDKANEQRLRYPRVFYGREGFYKEFIDLDAGMKVAMQLVSKGKYSDSDFLQTFLIESSSTKGKKNLVLVLTCEVIMLFEQAKEKKQWYIPTSQLTDVQFKENGVHFTSSKTIKKVKDKQVFISVPLIEQSQYILDQINTLRFQLEEENKIELLDS